MHNALFSLQEQEKLGKTRTTEKTLGKASCATAPPPPHPHSQKQTQTGCFHDLTSSDTVTNTDSATDVAGMPALATLIASKPEGNAAKHHHGTHKKRSHTTKQPFHIWPSLAYDAYD